jgi:hypothetical protein
MVPNRVHCADFWPGFIEAGWRWTRGREFGYCTTDIGGIACAIEEQRMQGARQGRGELVRKSLGLLSASSH